MKEGERRDTSPDLAGAEKGVAMAGVKAEA